MTATTIRVQMAQRKDTAANWTAANPILLSGEIGYETDTKKFKIGNGSTNWNSLAYLPIPDGSGNLIITGNLEIGSTGSLTFEGSTADGFETTLAVTNPTDDRTITLPNQSGTVLVSGNASIVDADIAANAEIAVSKLADGTARQLLQTDAAGTGVEWTSNIDVPGTLDVTSTATFDSIAQYPLGSADAPTITFTGDNNTGIYSPGADQVAISTGGSGRLFVDASGRVGVGASTPQHLLDCTSIGRFTGNTNSAASGAGIEIGYDSGNTTGFIQSYNRGSSTYLSTAVDGSDVRLKTSSIERCRIDSSGRLLVGASSASTAGTAVFQGNSGGATSHGIINIARGATNPGVNLSLGFTQFQDAAGSVGAQIYAQTDAAWSSGSYAGRLVFSTTANGASSPTERLRITSAGLVGIGTSSPIVDLDVAPAASTATFRIHARSNTTPVAAIELVRGTNTTFGADGSGDYRIKNDTGNLSFEYGDGGVTTERARIDSSGRLLVGTSTDSGGSKLQINDNRIRIATAKTPASATDTGVTGEICWDANYVYVCTATNTWKRTALATW